MRTLGSKVEQMEYRLLEQYNVLKHTLSQNQSSHLIFARFVTKQKRNFYPLLLDFNSKQGNAKTHEVDKISKCMRALNEDHYGITEGQIDQGKEM